MVQGHVAVIDVGTTGVKAIVFDGKMRVVARSYRRLRTYRGPGGRAEQSPVMMVDEAVSALREAVAASGVLPTSISGLGVTNQRETMILWDGRSGKPLHRAVLWEDERCKGACKLMGLKHGRFVRGMTGLPISSYFSAPEVRWILDHEKSVAAAARSGDLRFGTVDSWILWNLAEGAPHLTDRTNASRTLLYDIRKLDWDDGLMETFGVPSSCLPAVRPSASFFGTLRESIVGAPLPILAMVGDQQASTHAAIVRTGDLRGRRAVKVTYGTGAFVSAVIGGKFALREGFFTTLVPGGDGGPLYCLEAKIDRCGDAVAAAIGHPVKLNSVLRKLVEGTVRIIRRLPYRPALIVVDGGVTRDGIIESMLSAASGIRVVSQPIFDGTALGAALLASGTADQGVSLTGRTRH